MYQNDDGHCECGRPIASCFADGYDMKTGSFQTHSYPEAIKYKQLVVCALSCAAFVLTVLLSLRFFLRFAALFGAAQVASPSKLFTMPSAVACICIGHSHANQRSAKIVHVYL